MIDFSKLAHVGANEEQIFFLRPHWITQLPMLIGFIIVLVLPIATWFGIQTINPALFAVPGYDTLYIQTAGERERFIFEHIPHPVHVSKRILELAQKRRMEVQQGGGELM